MHLVKARSTFEGGLKRLGALMLLFSAVPLFPVGFGLMVYGLFLAIDEHSYRDPLSIGVALVVMSGLLLFSSRRLDSAAQLVRRRKIENDLLRLARRKGGRLTVTDAATETGYTAAETESLLKQLVEGGFVEIEVTEAGVMVYRFPEILYSTQAETNWSSGVETG